MRGGILRHRIEIAQKSVARDTFGAEVITWEKFMDAWADIQPYTGREFTVGEQEQAEITHRVRIRYRPGIKPTMRVHWVDKVFEITSVQDVRTRHAESVLMCKELL